MNIHLTPELHTFLIAMVPIIDLRVGIPWGIAMGLTPMTAFFWAICGNLLITIVEMKLFDPVIKLTRKIKAIDKFWTKIFHHTRTKHEANFEKYGPLFIMVFVAIPLPGSGAVVGAFAGYLFNLPFWKTFLYTALGAILAGVLIASGSQAVLSIMNIFS